MVSTPQVFDYKEYLRAVAALDPAVRSGAESDPELTDDAAVFFKNGGKVKAVFCPDAGNFKITLPGDLEL
jgi:2-C-methyl-D-erythritol 4-phosphate cytidylyltransferase